MEKAKKSTGKRHKVVDDKDQNVDRISALPDGLICHILSFLSTQLSVQTSVLAKRWTTLWAHVPVLDFDIMDCASESEDETSYLSPTILCTVMLRHKVQSLNTFNLTCTDDDGPTGCYQLVTCVATAIERNVKNLYLRLQIELPRCCLTCKTLVDLRLYDGVSIPSTGPISLPSLKKLYFYSVEDDVHLPRLISGCSVLEELIIGRIPCFDLGGCTISSPTLKSLTLNFPSDGDAYDIPDYRLKIDAPELRYLKVHDYMYHHISVSPMNSLVEADICLDTFGDSDELYPRCVLGFLDSLCNVKSLKLSGHDVEDVNLPVPGSVAKFDNLTKLEFSANWCFLSKFLESADHLQVLIIHEGDWQLKHWVEPIEEQCACLLYSLRNVRIDDFRHTEQSFNMVKYILRNALVLKWMEIYSQLCRGLGSEENSDAIQRISLFHRRSEECELSFS